MTWTLLNYPMGAGDGGPRESYGEGTGCATTIGVPGGTSGHT
jgi:hypothetical protein